MRTKIITACVLLCGICLVSLLATSHYQPHAKIQADAPLSQLGPSAPLDVPTLVRDSNTIVVGNVSSITDAGQVLSDPQCQTCGMSHRMIAAVKIDRVLKGPANSTIQIEYLVRESANHQLEPAGVDYSHGLFFLQCESSTPCRFTSNLYPYLVAASTPPPAIIGGTVHDRVVLELTHAVNAAGMPPADQARAIGSLDSVKGTIVIAALRRAAKSPNREVQLRSMESLFLHNDISELGNGITMMMNPPADFPEEWIVGLGYSIRAGVTNEQAVPELTRLLRSPNVEHRRIAAETLNRTGATGRGALIKALDDTDQKVRYLAVTGLAKTSGQTEGMPSLELFQKNEQHYLNHWRERMKKKN